MLNRIGPSIDPRGTIESTVLEKLVILLIFTICFRCLRFVSDGETLLWQNLDQMHVV